MKFAIIGGRDFNDKDLLYKTLNDYDITEIISGGARGADSLAEQYAYDNNIKMVVFKPDWSKGRSAGLIRNHDIISNADAVIAFWDKQSKGTKHSIDLSKQLRKPIEIINY